ncbi:MAG: hypothetical protein DRJ14_05300 [Acidobacteria bacterium]|nr:MAG: hypothetical protein DRJ14_05300 [Acidobacteriota bacterium]
MRKALLLAIFFLAIASFGDVLVTFNDGSVLKCDRVVKKGSQLLVVEKAGKKMSIKRKLVKAVKKTEKVIVPGARSVADGQVAGQGKTEKAKPGSLVLTDDNVERTVPYKPYALIEQEKKIPEAVPAVSINMVTQKTTRTGDTVTFEGAVKNDMTETVHNLKMVVQALDGKGKVFAETASQIATKIAVGQTAIFSFQFKDPSARISRFSFRFEGESGGSAPK